jgi:hypothetical protein
MLRHSGVVKRGYREILDIDYKYDIPYQKKAPNCINGKFMLPERATRDEDSALSGAVTGGFMDHEVLDDAAPAKRPPRKFELETSSSIPNIIPSHRTSSTITAALRRSSVSASSLNYSKKSLMKSSSIWSSSGGETRKQLRKLRRSSSAISIVHQTQNVLKARENIRRREILKKRKTTALSFSRWSKDSVRFKKNEIFLQKIDDDVSKMQPFPGPGSYSVGGRMDAEDLHLGSIEDAVDTQEPPANLDDMDRSISAAPISTEPTKGLYRKQTQPFKSNSSRFLSTEAMNTHDVRCSTLPKDFRGRSRYEYTPVPTYTDVVRENLNVKKEREKPSWLKPSSVGLERGSKSNLGGGTNTFMNPGRTPLAFERPRDWNMDDERLFSSSNATREVSKFKGRELGPTYIRKAPGKIKLERRYLHHTVLFKQRNNEPKAPVSELYLRNRELEEQANDLADAKAWQQKMKSEASMY